MNRHAKPLALGLAALLSEPCFADFSTGTGFAVTTSKLITNYHVVKGCSDVAVVTGRGNRKARVVAYDEEADLALLHSLGVSSAVAPLRQAEPRLGEWAGVFGFPLTGTLTATGNFTDGVVSALRGIDEDASKFQFTAPIQQGNSGGPLLDASGNVIGVVVAKLNVLNQAKTTGDIAQNVNFAVSSSILKSFISEQKVPFTSGTSKRILSGEQIAATAKDFTFLLVCEPTGNSSVAKAPTPITRNESAENPKRIEPPDTNAEVSVPTPNNSTPLYGESWNRDVAGEFVALRVFDKNKQVTYVDNFKYMGPSSVLENGPALKIGLKKCVFRRVQSGASNYYGDGAWKDCETPSPAAPKSLTLVVEFRETYKYFKFDPNQSVFIWINKVPHIKKELEAGRSVKIKIENDYLSLKPEDGEFIIQPEVLPKKLPTEPSGAASTANPDQSTEDKSTRDRAAERCSAFLEGHRRDSERLADNASTYMAFLKRAVSACFHEPQAFSVKLRTQRKAEGRFRDLVGLSVKVAPDGKVLTVTTHASSGMQSYDDALKQAIWDASPLPLPANQKLFREEFLMWVDLSTLSGP